MPLRIILMGTGDFALPPFRAVMDSAHRVVGVVTQPDRSGRGHHQHINAVKELAVARGIDVLQPDKASQPEFLDQLRAMQPDLILVAAYGQILRASLLAIPRLGAFNLHGSLLPRHRGAAPVQYAIWSGDATTGVSMFRIEPALDSGPVCGVVTTPILPRETSGELMLRLADLCVPMTLQTLHELETGTAAFTAQDATRVTLAPKIPREAGIIDWSRSRRQIDCHIRAMQPWPKAMTTLRRSDGTDMRCLIQAVEADSPRAPAGCVPPGTLQVTSGQLFVCCGDGWIEVLQLQLEGRRSTDARAFLNGIVLGEGDSFV